MKTAVFATVIAAVGIAAIAPVAHAAGPLDNIVTSFQTVSTGWQGPLRADALGTFGVLAVISLFRAAMALIFRNADMSEWLSEIVGQIMHLGFFLLLLINSVTYGNVIIQSFRYAATGAGGVGISPTDVFNAGITICAEVFHQIAWTAPGRDIMLTMGALVIIGAFALIAAEMLVTLCETYIVISASVLFMAFGALDLTKDIAISVLRYTFSVGAKLFILQLIVSIGQGFITQWTTQFTTFTLPAFLTVIGSSLVMFVLVTKLPTVIQGVVNGSHGVGGNGGSALIGAAAFVTTTAVAVGAAAAGAPVAAAQAARLASSQVNAKDAVSGTQSSFGQKAMRVMAGTGKNLGQAAASDVGRRMTGQSSGRGSAPWRMSADMAIKRRLLDEDIKKPETPADSNSIS